MRSKSSAGRGALRRCGAVGTLAAIIGIVPGSIGQLLGGSTASATQPVPSSLKPPVPLKPFGSTTMAGEGRWHPIGRSVDNRPAVYETMMRSPGSGSSVAAVAWMDTKLLRARLYSGSLSPGGTFWKYAAPISPSAATKLVVAFEGGYQMNDTFGGYLSEGHLVAPLRNGSASLVIYKNGSAVIGKWGRDVTMSSQVASVRQNLTLLVDQGRPVPGLNPNDFTAWGYSLHKIATQWRAGLGQTASGAFVYVVGQLNVVDLAQLLARAGAVRAMTVDMNPEWTIFASYSPTKPNGQATPANGVDLLPTMMESPARFFTSAYTRDFVTMSAP
jgi:hypothetical protein